MGGDAKIGEDSWVQKLVNAAAAPVAEAVASAAKKEAERRKPPLWMIAIVAYIALEMTS